MAVRSLGLIYMGCIVSLSYACSATNGNDSETPISGATQMESARDTEAGRSAAQGQSNAGGLDGRPTGEATVGGTAGGERAPFMAGSVPRPDDVGGTSVPQAAETHGSAGEAVAPLAGDIQPNDTPNGPAAGRPAVNAGAPGDMAGALSGGEGNGVTGGVVAGQNATFLGPRCLAEETRCDDACQWLAECAEESNACVSSPRDLITACVDACAAMPMSAQFLCGLSDCESGFALAMNTQVGFADACNTPPAAGAEAGGIPSGGWMAGGADAGGNIVSPLDTQSAQTLLTEACAPCHTVNQQPPVMDNLEDLFWVRAQQLNIPYLHPGNRQRSYIYHKMAGSHVDAGGNGSVMPPQGALNAQVVARLGEWIDSLEGTPPPQGGAFGFGGQPALGGMAPLGPLDTEGVQLKIDATCGCHGIGGRNPVMTRITDLIGVDARQTNMPYITAGDRTQSYLYHKIAQTHREVGGNGDWMPPTAIPYSPEEVDQIGDWIDGL